MDLGCVTNEITAIVLAIYDNALENFVEPKDSLQNNFFKIVVHNAHAQQGANTRR